MQKSLQTRCGGYLRAYTITHISMKYQVSSLLKGPSLLLLPLFQRLQSSPWLPKLLSYSLRLRKDLVKLGIKAKGPRGPRKRVRGLSPPQKPRMLPRLRKLKLRQRKQRPRIEKLILRPTTLPRQRKLKLRQMTPLPPSRARKKLPLL